MSTEEPLKAASPAADGDARMEDAPPPSAAAPTTKQRPRLNLSALGAGGGVAVRKRGKSMFGVLVNTLNKAKAEDKERNASEAAKKRQLTEKRLQQKLRKDADSVRLAEEAKRDKLTASRREEELQLKDSIYKLRHTRFPLLSNFLLTSDIIPSIDSEADASDASPLASLVPPRSHPPPLYYLPAILTPAQEAFLSKRKTQVKEAADKDWDDFKAERAAGVEEIASLRQKVAEVNSSKALAEEADGEANGDTNGTVNGNGVPTSATATIEEERHVDDAPREESSKDAEMEVDDGAKEEREPEHERKNERPVPVEADEDDVVEY
ncbi:hypothetical protein DFH11DRAFT_771111 [Phellopilus nigrolimitatus]|nr:hypothetical protein DFH11DRAFT_771111 [Phellopilus nigrolimitatus]